MTYQRYMLFASLSCLILGCILLQQSRSLAFMPASGLTQKTSVNIMLTASSAHNRSFEGGKNNNTPIAHTAQSKAFKTDTSAIKHMSNPVISSTAHTLTANKIKSISHQINETSEKDTVSPRKQTQKRTPIEKTSSIENKQRQDVANKNQEVNSLDSQQAHIKKTANKQQTILQSIEVKRPTFTSPPAQPHYPRLARKKGFEGITTLEVLFDQAGKQLSLTLISSSGFNLLDKAAVDAVKKWQFSAPDKQTAYAYKVRVPIRFSLH
ncbi:energy transducer TonB [uncultured Shewanella sp.]|uniref:energy transducer TonB n=1 Tax=uncultured Shewanella sp. TaxID=173975 RepID=UPI00261A43BA|nr:energy transducer TonB [uncultured Shewanella sp.]